MDVGIKIASGRGRETIITSRGLEIWFETFPRLAGSRISGWRRAEGGRGTGKTQPAYKRVGAYAFSPQVSRAQTPFPKEGIGS